jgi:hypothetical protein
VNKLRWCLIAAGGTAASAVLIGQLAHWPNADNGTAAVVVSLEVPAQQRSPSVNSDEVAGNEYAGIQRALSEMPDPERNSVVRLAIQDAGHVCDDIVSVTDIDYGRPVWRVSCEQALVYLVSVGELQQLIIEPTPWHEF